MDAHVKERIIKGKGDKEIGRRVKLSVGMNQHDSTGFDSTLVKLS